ncbi:hypothetical protein D3C73_395150 [compost metagenome]
MFRYSTDYRSFFFFLLLNYVVTLPILAGMFFWAFRYVGWNAASTPLFVFLMIVVMIVLAINSYRVVRTFAQQRDIEDLGFR